MLTYYTTRLTRFSRTVLGTYQTLRPPVYVRVVEARIAHGRGINQRRDFSEVLCAELVEDADIRILELREELESTTRLLPFIPN